MGNFSLNEKEKKYFLAFPILVYLLLYMATLAGNPQLGGEDPEVLTNKVSNFLLKEDPKSFPAGSYKNPKTKKPFIESSPYQPVLSVNLGDYRVPLLVNAKSSALPHFVFKIGSDIFGLKFTKVIFDLFIGLATLIFFHLVVSRKYGDLAYLATPLVALSPIFSMSMNYHIGGQLIPVLFWMILYFLEHPSKKKVIACLLFLLGVHINLGFIFLGLPIFILAPNAFTENKKPLMITLAVASVYSALLLGLPLPAHEPIANQFLKPLAHLSFFFQELLQFFVAPIAFTSQLLAGPDASYLYEKTLRSLGPLKAFGVVEIINTLIVLPALIMGLMKSGQARRVLFSLLVWSLILFIGGPIQNTYGAEIMVCAPLVALLLAFAFIKARDFHRALFPFLVAVQLVFYGQWYYLFNKVGPHPKNSISLHQNIASFLEVNDIRTPYLTGNQAPWGVIETLSDEKVTPIYLRTTGLGQALKWPKKKEFYLIYMPERTHRNKRWDKDYAGHTKRQIRQMVEKNNLLVSPVHEFYSHGRLIYWLVRIENPKKP